MCTGSSSTAEKTRCAPPTRTSVTARIAIRSAYLVRAATPTPYRDSSPDFLHLPRRGSVTLRALFPSPFRSARRPLMVRTWTVLLFAVALAAPALLAQQPPPPLPPEVGNH